MGELIVDGEPVSTIWTSAYYVPEQFRASLMGVRLLLELQRLNPTVSACNVSQMALPVFQKLKWYQFALARHLLVRSSRPVVERYVRSRWPAAAARRVLDTGLLAHRTVIRGLGARRLRGLHCVQVDRMPSELDVHLTRRDHRFAAAPHRSAAWVDWLLGNSFATEAHSRKGLFVVHDDEGDVAGYFLVKRRFYPMASHHGFSNVVIGSLEDWLSVDEERLDEVQLSLLAVGVLDGWECDVVELCLPPGPAHEWYRRRGVPRLGALHLFVRPSLHSPLRDDRFRNQAAWRLTPAEGDNFFS